MRRPFEIAAPIVCSLLFSAASGAQARWDLRFGLRGPDGMAKEIAVFEDDSDVRALFGDTTYSSFAPALTYLSVWAGSQVTRSYFLSSPCCSNPSDVDVLQRHDDGSGQRSSSERATPGTGDEPADWVGGPGLETEGVKSNGVARRLPGLSRFEAGGSPASFTGLGDLPGGPVNTQVASISPDGTVIVGRSTAVPPIGFSQPFEAFLWTEAGGMVGLGDLDGGVVESHALDVSAGGTVIVGTTDSSAFLWTDESGMTPLVDLSGGLPHLIPTCISDDGTVVAGHGFPVTGGTVIFRWCAGTGVEDLGALPNQLGFPDAFAFALSGDGAVIAGGGLSSRPDVEPLRWTEGTGLVGLGDVPGGLFYALALGVSGDGVTLVGGARTNVLSRDEAFVWTPADDFLLLDPSHGVNGGSFAYAASADGAVVVGYAEELGGAMVWDELRGMRSLRQILVGAGLDLTGWTLGVALDVSADGRVVVGNGTNPDGDSEGWRAVLPQRPRFHERIAPTSLQR